MSSDNEMMSAFYRGCGQAIQELTQNIPRELQAGSGSKVRRLLADSAYAGRRASETVLPSAGLWFQEMKRHYFCHGIRMWFVSGIAALLLAGCGAAAPSCSGPNTLGVVRKIFSETVVKIANQNNDPSRWIEQVAHPIKLDVTAIRTIGAADKSGTISCAAALDVTLPDDISRLAAEASGKSARTFGHIFPVDVEYTTQMTDDQKQQFVQMSGHLDLAKSVVYVARYAEASRTLQGYIKKGTASSAQASVALTQQSISTATKTTSDATLVGIECGDYCLLQYKTTEDQMKSTLCVDAPICRQWADDPNSFKKHVGSHVVLKLGSQFVPEGGETVDSLVALE